MPNAPVTPATTPHHNDERGGMGSRVSHAKSSMKSKPQAWAPVTTRNTLARLVAIPPAKSPAPQTTAAPRLRAAPVSVSRFMEQLPVASCQNLEIPVSGQAQNSSSHLVRVSRLSHSPVLASASKVGTRYSKFRNL